MRDFAIVFDVGGLFIKTAVVDDQGVVVPGSYTIYPSHSKESSENLLNYFVDLAKQQANSIMIKSYQINGIGFAFPGPFDYERGISLIRHVDKFEHIYGINIRQELMKRLDNDPSFSARCSQEFRIVFENDTNLFALGEFRIGKAKQYNKAMYMTIGNGAGSAFLENGQLVKERSDVPENGWIYNQSFRDSIVDDYISRRGLVRLMKQMGLVEQEIDIKQAAELAMAGNVKAIAAFGEFGTMIGEMVAPYLDCFKPEALIIGGQIMKSRGLFHNHIQKALSSVPVIIEYSNETSLSTFAGVFSLLKHQKNLTV